MESIEYKKMLYKRYGTTKPKQEYHSVYNPVRNVMERISIKELVDTVGKRLKELEAQKAQWQQIQRVRKINLDRKRKEQEQIQACRKKNLLIRDLERNGIQVRKR